MEFSSSNEKIMQRYVDLLKNSGFKAVFGDRNNKDVVMSVINALLPPHRKVMDIKYAPTEHHRYRHSCCDCHMPSPHSSHIS